jgi:hypothetical protein
MVAVAATLLASCTGAPGADGRLNRSPFVNGQCFRGDDVNNFNVKDKQTAYVSTRQGYVYRLSAASDCFRTGSIGVSVARFRRGDDGVCIGDIAAVSVGQWRSGATLCLTQVSGPIWDSSISGLRSRRPPAG